jgi:hypothetical protein
MKCSYHPAVDSQEACSACSKPMCAECTHKIKGKPYCQDCLIQGAEWAATVKGLKLPSDAPKRAALCAIIPGIGAVYNNEYMKAVTYFAVWAALSVMGSRVHGVFGFGAVVFVVFTMFDAHRTAEAQARRRLQPGYISTEPLQQDRTIIGWGVFLILLGFVFLLQNVIPDYFFVNRLWPLVFILLGGYLVYRAMKGREKQMHDSAASPIVGPREDL